MGKEDAMLMIFAVSYLTLCCHFASSLNIDESSLLALKAHLKSGILANNWSQETSFCTWIGVGCSRRHQRVTRLDLSGMGIWGSIGREIGNLFFLAFLSIQNNSISGPIPGEIGNLRRLGVLDMAMNQLSDPIPQSIGLLTKLKYLDLSRNTLSGNIPESISTCIQLNTLDLSYNTLTGNIPPALGNLSQLVALYFIGNQLTGELSWRILNISSLQYFSVRENHFSGSIPTHVCSTPVSNLKYLGLFSNQFEGDFPLGLIPCHSLKRLFLGRNKFRGTIPPWIANFTSLEWFDIQENNFHGAIPPEMGHLSSLTILTLDMNELNGEVPLSIFNLSRLQSLGFGTNNLSGTLPFTIDEGLHNIQEIYLSDNQFHGNIPTSISNLSKLTLLELRINSFSGHIPITLGTLRLLRVLKLDENYFTNNMSVPEQDFLSSLLASNYLQTIAISLNPITGLLPKSFGSSNLSASLQKFHASYCQLRSPLPSEIGNLTKLIILDLGSNHLSGPIPTALGNLRNLQVFSMYGNMWQGSIPHAICNLGNLFFIELSDNHLSGQLPTCVGKLSFLREIYLGGNVLNFTIPSILWFNEHVQRLNLSNNFLHGYVPGEISNMRELIELDLSTNQLSGEIPTSISQLQKLIDLRLSNNKLNGPLIDSLSDLKDLHYLDLSHNQLSGPIPKSLEKLVNLKDFNVSFNELRGEIPNGGPFLNFTPESFAGNEHLCGASQFGVRACKGTSHAPSRLLKFVLPAVASVVVVAIILILVLTLGHGRKLSPSLFNLPRLVMRERISYYAILRATSNLHEENLIGRGSFGSVYKGNFSSEMIAAVKVFNLEVQGALRSFDTECKILRSIRHRNLVKVITSCTNLDFKALVMAYMPNGNLEKWLYSGTTSLNISQRLEMMLDVASAVEYLHEGYTFPIVHCDLKPSNILLDEDMIAHVGDFGIAKLLTQEQRMQHTKTLGTIGYIAPEYGSQGVVSTMVDMYSYGILLMEVFTRRKPTDEMFSGNLTMRRWVSESFPNSVMQIVVEEVVNMDLNQRNRGRRECCLTSIMELALECSTDMPEERPKMKDVVSRMRKIHSNLLIDEARRRNRYA